MNHCIYCAERRECNQKEQVFHLKLLVHLFGDLHQPLHVGRAEDRGGNDIKVTWHYKKSNLHRVWDTQMIESWNMSYTELGQNIGTLSKGQVQSIEEGTFLTGCMIHGNWSKASMSRVEDDKLGYRYSYNNFGTVMEQLQKAGIRLASVLNDIYG